jgi:hypothetical protein
MAMVNDADSLKWGFLVKSWATGLDYFATPAKDQPPQAAPAAPPAWTLPALKPANFEETVGGAPIQRTIPGALHLSTEQFKDLLKEAGINTVNYPPGTTDVIIVQGSATTMVIRLPPTSVLKASEANLLAGGAYPVFTFYDPLYKQPGGPPPHAQPPKLPDRKGIMELHANRIGDYTMGLCA